MGCSQSNSSNVTKAPTAPGDEQFMPPGLDRSYILNADDYKVVKYIAEGGMVSRRSILYLHSNTSVPGCCVFGVSIIR